MEGSALEPKKPFATFILNGLTWTHHTRCTSKGTNILNKCMPMFHNGHTRWMLPIVANHDGMILVSNTWSNVSNALFQSPDTRVVPTSFLKKGSHDWIIDGARTTCNPWATPK